MQVTPVDNELNLFRVEHAVPVGLAEKVLATDWLNLSWTRQEGQENWSRRRIQNNIIPWANEWDTTLAQSWSNLQHQLGIRIGNYFGTAWWVDEPGFTCDIHTDGEMPGSMHLIWHGPGTAFYWHRDPATLRYQTPANPNAGYIMINRADASGYRPLLWHAMLEPSDSYRVTSYTWITPL